MNFKISAICLAVLGSLACNTRPATEVPEFPDGGLLKDAQPIDPVLLAKFDGLLEATGNLDFGFPVVMHGTGKSVSLFGDVNASYARMEAGCIDDRFIVEGKTRISQTTDAGLIRLELFPAELAKKICDGEDFEFTDYDEVYLEGSRGRDALDTPTRLNWFSTFLGDENFNILSHRGGCRTIDECGFSENSTENIQNAQSLGATGTEVDIIITKDGVPILYHDATFTSRLVQGSHCVGEVASYTYEQIQALCRLQFGEAIPTLDDSLAAVVYDTDLNIVWLDTKTPDVVSVAIERSLKFNALAAEEGRQLTIGVGIPKQDVYDEFIKQLAEARKKDPDVQVPCLVELEPDQVREAECKGWGPRFTQGPQQPQIDEFNTEGIGTIYWTVNRQQDIDVMLTESAPAGILTDRVHLVIQRYQALAYEGRLHE